MVSVALRSGATYIGADFSCTPPDRSLRPAAPSVTVIGTGKRTGKTAISGVAAGTWRDAGLRPVIIAMGRGGPPEPEVIDAGTEFDAGTLLGFFEAGRHAASDYIEDAMCARVATVGAWRAGGGLAGGIAYSNFRGALAGAEALNPGLLVLEGSGAAGSPPRLDAGVLGVG